MSLKQINEVGGTIILRIICSILAIAMVYGLFSSILRGSITVTKGCTYAAGIVLFGAYAVFGSRLQAK